MLFRSAVESYKLGSYTPSTCSGYIVKPYDSVSNTAGICACDPKINVLWLFTLTDANCGPLPQNEVAVYTKSYTPADYTTTPVLYLEACTSPCAQCRSDFMGIVGSPTTCLGCISATNKLNLDD